MGKIHSIETFGTVDGPGVRFVVFFQGCPMRCLYCHNPDTWDFDGGQDMGADELLERFCRNRSFYRTGGLTATGGEPMAQPEFLTELFEKAKALGIHTCLDTSGILFPGEAVTADGADAGEAVTADSPGTGKMSTADSPDAGEALCRVDRLLGATDLVMLDIKHIDGGAHRRLTGHDNRNVLAFARHLDALGKPVWIRHVAVPGITFQKEALRGLGRFLKTLSNVEKLEVLPYHAMGKVKYESLGLAYPLADTPQLTKAEAKEAEEMILHAWRED